MENPVSEERVIGVVTDYFYPDEVVVARDTPFVELGLDSLDMIEIAMELEEEFDVDIPLGNPWIKLATVGDVINYFNEPAKNL
ncbi:MAG: phosphopantetheine-binding protein [bacterium]